jgi:hypothetical protein
MLRIDSTQQLTLIEAEANGVIGLPHPRRPGRLLARHDRRQTIHVRDDVVIDRFVEGVQPGLISCRTVIASLPF